MEAEVVEEVEKEEGKEGVRRRRRRSWMRGRTVKVLSDCKCDGGLSRHCEALFVNCADSQHTNDCIYSCRFTTTRGSTVRSRTHFFRGARHAKDCRMIRPKAPDDVM